MVLDTSKHRSRFMRFVHWLATFGSILLLNSYFAGALSTAEPVSNRRHHDDGDYSLKLAIKETSKLKDFYDKSTFLNQPEVFVEEPPVRLLENVDTILFDCDGVLYQNQYACPGAADCIRSLLNKGKQVLFVTNNAGVNRRELREKLAKVLDLDGYLTAGQMVSSSYASANYLKDHLPEGSKVFVIGGAGLCEELSGAGFTVIGGSDNKPNKSNLPSMNRQELASYDFSTEAPVDAVVVGHDTEFTFRKLCIANNLLLRSPNALFVATNLDSFDLVVGSAEEPCHIPGNGCVVKALEHCSQRNAVNVGKPSAELATLLKKEHGLDMARCLFVGDRLDTDILFANLHGMKSVLVMTGVTTAEQLIQLGPGSSSAEPLLPTYILPYVGRLAS